jgi:hypothetical protein
MPTVEGSYAEDLAIDAVCIELRRLRHEVSLVARPDREPFHMIRVDAVVNVDGQLLALDHFSAGRPSGPEGAVAVVKRVLAKKLDGQLAEARRIACCYTGVVFDQQAASDPVTKWLISPGELNQLLAEVAARRPRMLDVAWTLGADGRIAMVFGSWPPAAANDL